MNQPVKEEGKCKLKLKLGFKEACPLPLPPCPPGKEARTVRLVLITDMPREVSGSCLVLPVSWLSNNSE